MARMKLGVVGLGYVGLPLLVEAAQSGFEAVGIDLDQRKISAITAGENYIEDVNGDDLRKFVKEGRLRATSDWDVVSELDAISICVPTPLRKTKDPDISFIVAAMEEIGPRLRKGQTVILESTTYPGTTDELVLPEFERDRTCRGQGLLPRVLTGARGPGQCEVSTRATRRRSSGASPQSAPRRRAEFYSAIFEHGHSRVVHASAPRW